MSKINPATITPKELKEVTDFLKKKNVDLQIMHSPQAVRRMEDGGLVIDPPKFTTRWVKVSPVKGSNGEIKTS